MEFNPDKHFYGNPCSKCGTTIKYIKGSRCIACKKAGDKDYNSKNNDARKKYYAEYYQKNKEIILHRVAEYEQKNKEIVLQKDRDRYYRKQEYHKENSRRFRENNPGYTQRKWAEWEEKNPEINKYAKRKKGIKRRAIKRLAQHVPYKPKALKERMEFFSNTCVYCGATENIAVDHFYPISKGGLDAIINLVPACGLCNSSKGATDPIEWMRWKGLSEGHIMLLVKMLMELSEED